jgi:protein gp37
MTVKIDPEFEGIIPEIPDHERAELSDSLMSIGCRDPLSVWDQGEDQIILDGHTRFKICIENDIPFDTKPVSDINSREEAKIWMIKWQISRRNLQSGQRMNLISEMKDLIEIIRQRAKERQLASRLNGRNPDGTPRVSSAAQIFAEPKEPIETRKELARLAGVSHGTMDKFRAIKTEAAPEVVDQVVKGELSVNKAFNQVKQVRQARKEVVDPTFNPTTDSIEWARWSWNPVTGCEHGCEYCYARAMVKTYKLYPEGFKPTFRPNKLNAPMKTKLPEKAATDVGYKNVFVCSMADLFGDWVPQEWINGVMEACRKAPQWNYLFLTKNPSRLPYIEFPDTAWVGTTVDVQSRVEAAVDAMAKVKAPVRFLSCEPLKERIVFPTLKDVDWLIIGGQSSAGGSAEFQPEWEWVEQLLNQARKHDCKVYFKPNLKIRPREYPCGGC